MSLLLDAIHARRMRAVEVHEDYQITYVGCQGWVAQHPDEPERIYYVDMIERSCTCPDSKCFRIDGEQIDCKHIIACDPLREELTGKRLPFVRNGRATEDCGFTVVKDAGADGEDPFAPL